MSNLPAIEELFIICEGQTEEKLLHFLEHCFKDTIKYKLEIINAKGKDKIVKKYKRYIKLHNYSTFYLMYDLDNNTIVKDIMNIYKKENIPIKESNIFFVNPRCELILCLLKKDNPNINKLELEIETLYGIEKYDKSDKTLDRIFKQIDANDVNRLLNNLKKLSTNDNDPKSSNYYDLISKVYGIEK